MSGTSSFLDSLQELKQKADEFAKELDSRNLEIKKAEELLRDLNVKKSYSMPVPLFRGNYQGHLSLVWGEHNSTWKLLCKFRHYDHESANAYTQAVVDSLDVGVSPPDEEEFMSPPKIQSLLGSNADFRICASHILNDFVTLIAEEHFRLTPKPEKSFDELMAETNGFLF